MDSNIQFKRQGSCDRITMQRYGTKDRTINTTKNKETFETNDTKLPQIDVKSKNQMHINRQTLLSPTPTKFPNINFNKNSADMNENYQENTSRERKNLDAYDIESTSRETDTTLKITAKSRTENQTYVDESEETQETGDQVNAEKELGDKNEKKAIERKGTSNDLTHIYSEGTSQQKHSILNAIKETQQYKITRFQKRAEKVKTSSRTIESEKSSSHRVSYEYMNTNYSSSANKITKTDSGRGRVQEIAKKSTKEKLHRVKESKEKQDIRNQESSKKKGEFEIKNEKRAKENTNLSLDFLTPGTPRRSQRSHSILEAIKDTQEYRNRFLRRSAVCEIPKTFITEHGRDKSTSNKSTHDHENDNDSQTLYNINIISPSISPNSVDFEKDNATSAASKGKNKETLSLQTSSRKISRGKSIATPSDTSPRKNSRYEFDKIRASLFKSNKPLNSDGATESESDSDSCKENEKQTKTIQSKEGNKSPKFTGWDSDKELPSHKFCKLPEFKDIAIQLGEWIKSQVVVKEQSYSQPKHLIARSHNTQDSVREYLSRNGINEIFQIMTEAMLIGRPDSPLDFLIEFVHTLGGKLDHIVSRNMANSDTEGPSSSCARFAESVSEKAGS